MDASRRAHCELYVSRGVYNTSLLCCLGKRLRLIYRDIARCRLARWIKQYFDPPNQPIPAPTDVNTALMNSSPIVSTDKMPIILQYNGHSQTIVGYEQMRDGSVNLLTLDPGR